MASLSEAIEPTTRAFLESINAQKGRENYFAEVEQACFNPANFVPGIGPSPDRILQGRLFAYGDAQRHRLGVNADQIPVNRPKGMAVANYDRDGALRTDGNHGRAKNYAPNSFDGPQPTGTPTSAPIEVNGLAAAQVPEGHPEDDDVTQAGLLYRVMKEDERKRLVERLAGSLSLVSRAEVVERVIGYFCRADREYGERVAAAVAARRRAA